MSEIRRVDMKLETRTADGGGCVFIGRPIVYDAISELIAGKFRERFARGAFRNWLATKPDVLACIDHDCSKILGRTSAGTLRLHETNDGIDIECTGPNTTYARDLQESIGRGDIRGMSFHFDHPRCEWERDADGMQVRTITEAILYEVSFLANPAYPQTVAGLRSLDVVLADAPAPTYPLRSQWDWRLKLRERQ